MKSQKFDGVIESVRYSPDGKVDIVRAFERRGATFSDQVLIPRGELIRRIKEGKVYVVGIRKIYWAGTFDVKSAVKILKSDGKEILANTENHGKQDNLNGVPIF